MQKGSIIIPLLVIAVVAFGVLLTTNSLYNKSAVNMTQTFKPSSVQKTSQSNNLQLKTIEFTKTAVTPTAQPTSAACRADSGMPIDPAACNCPDMQIHCVGGVVVDVNGLPPRYNYDFFCSTNGVKKYGDGYYCFGKPVIYLYPSKPTFVTVTLSIPGKITTSIPEFEGINTDKKSLGGWKNVLAFPSGVLKYKNNYYKELYYESAVKNVKKPDNGIFLSSSDIHSELIKQGQKLGLLVNESEEFADYWTPRLESLHKKYIFFSIISKEEKKRTDNVEISPAPSTFIEFITYFKGVDTKFKTKQFEYPNVPNRTGFTAVEWGGTIEY